MCLCKGDVASLFIHRYSRCFAHVSQPLMFNANVNRGQQCDLSRIQDAVNIYSRDESSKSSKSQEDTYQEPRASALCKLQAPRHYHCYEVEGIIITALASIASKTSGGRVAISVPLPLVDEVHEVGLSCRPLTSVPWLLSRR